jgi:hypothetical protein
MKRIFIIILFLPSAVFALSAVITSFSAGEITPRLYGRTDVEQFYDGCRVIENMFVKPQGPAQKRPGTYYVAEAAGEARLIGFVVSTENAHVLEFSEGSIRFFTDE